MWIFSRFRDAVMCMHRCDLRVHVYTNVLYDTFASVSCISKSNIRTILISNNHNRAQLLSWRYNIFKEARGAWNLWPRDKESHSLCIELARHPMWSYNPWIGYPSLSLEVIIQGLEVTPRKSQDWWWMWHWRMGWKHQFLCFSHHRSLCKIIWQIQPLLPVMEEECNS